MSPVSGMRGEERANRYATGSTPVVLTIWDVAQLVRATDC